MDIIATERYMEGEKTGENHTKAPSQKLRSCEEALDIFRLGMNRFLIFRAKRSWDGFQQHPKKKPTRSLINIWDILIRLQGGQRVSQEVPARSLSSLWPSAPAQGMKRFPHLLHLSIAFVCPVLHLTLFKQSSQGLPWPRCLV